MRRRDIVAGVVAVALSPTGTHAGKMVRLAIAHPSHSPSDLNPKTGLKHYRALADELEKLGYSEGWNLEVQRYSAEGRADRYDEVAHRIVDAKPEAIFAVSLHMALAIRAVSRTVPIVALTPDPVALGLATTLARPGGNVTGVTTDVGREVWGKRLELLREVAPSVSKVAFLTTHELWEAVFATDLGRLGERLKLPVVGIELRAPVDAPEYQRAFAEMARDGVDGLIVQDAPVNLTNRALIVEYGEAGRLPIISSHREYVEAGGLMAYSMDYSDQTRHAARQIAEIFRGVPAAEIPFFQATKFELLLSRPAAERIGLAIPPTLLARADEVIE